MIKGETMKSGSKYVANFIRIIFGSVFILSAITKFIDLNSFTIALSKFQLLNERLIPFFTFLIPSIELLFGLLLVINIRVDIIAQLTTFLIALFTAVVISKVFEGEQISCGCFGNLTKGSIDFTTIIRNIILLSLGIVLTVYYQKKYFVKRKTNITTNNSLKLSTESYWWKNLKTTLLVTLFFFLATQVLIFSFQNRELKNRIYLLTTNRDVLQSKDTTETFTALDMNGNRKEFDFKNDLNKKVLIYIFSTHCEACKLNTQNWIYITNKLQNKNLEIIGISLDSLKSSKEYFQKNKLNFPVYSSTGDEFKIKFKAFITPQTILLNEKGIVIKDWPGILNIFSVKEILNKILI